MDDLMDEKTVRKHIEEVSARLRRTEQERDVLLALLKGYEGWLRLYGVKQPGTAPRLSLELDRKPAEAKDRPSLRQSVLKVLKEARGEPLHVREIWLRVQALGATTRSSNPEGIVDLTAYTLRKEGIEKVDPRTWKWTGGRRSGIEGKTERKA